MNFITFTIGLILGSIGTTILFLFLALIWSKRTINKNWKEIIKDDQKRN